MKNKQLLIHILIGVFIVVVDQLTKILTLQNFYEGQSIAIIPNFFQLTFVKNTGAAWGMFNSNPVLLGLFSVAVLILFGYVYITNHDKIVKTLLGLIIAGAIGNQIDRFRLNYVVDFLDFNIFGYNFPVFNVADIAVTVGAIILFGYILIGEKHAVR